MKRDELEATWPGYVANIVAFRRERNLALGTIVPSVHKLPAELLPFVDEVSLLAFSHLTVRLAAAKIVDPQYARDYVRRYDPVLHKQLDWARETGEDDQADIFFDFALDLALLVGHGERYQRAVDLENGY